MSYQAAKESYAAEIAEIKAAGLWKTERVIASDQKNAITLEGGANVVNMCANNYLGLANNTEVKQAASDSLNEWGFGAASVRFICGTQSSGSVAFWEWRTPFFTPPVLTPTPDFSRLFWGQRTPSFLTS
jgi:hypothetical protein